MYLWCKKINDYYNNLKLIANYFRRKLLIDICVFYYSSKILKFSELIYITYKTCHIAGKYKRFKASEAASNDLEARGGEPGPLPPGVPSQALREMERARWCSLNKEEIMIILQLSKDVLYLVQQVFVLRLIRIVLN